MFNHVPFRQCPIWRSSPADQHLSQKTNCGTAIHDISTAWLCLLQSRKWGTLPQFEPSVSRYSTPQWRMQLQVVQITALSGDSGMCAPRERHGESVFFITSRCCFCLVLPNRTRRERRHHCLFLSCRWGVCPHLVYGVWYYVFPIVVTGCTV